MIEALRPGQYCFLTNRQFVFNMFISVDRVSIIVWGFALKRLVFWGIVLGHTQVRLHAVYTFTRVSAFTRVRAYAHTLNRGVRKISWNGFTGRSEASKTMRSWPGESSVKTVCGRIARGAGMRMATRRIRSRDLHVGGESHIRSV